MVTKMKKILLFLTILLLVGCEKDLNNTPTKRVEVFLSNYQSLSEEVEGKIIADADEMPELTGTQREDYINLWKKHFQGMTYEIKDEKIDGHDATVTATIEVTDYSETLKNVNNALSNTPEMFQDELGNHSFILYNDYRINALKETTERIKYTIEFKLKKVKRKWILQELSTEDEQKMTGMYEEYE